MHKNFFVEVGLDIDNQINVSQQTIDERSSLILLQQCTYYPDEVVGKTL